MGLFPNDGACLAHIFRVRFGEEPWCPKCKKHAKNWYRIAGTKRFQHPCGYAIHPLAKTVFAHSVISLQLLFYAMLHVSNSAESINVNTLARHFGVTQRTAYRILRKIRIHLSALENSRFIGNPDETVVVRLQTLNRVRTAKGFRNRARYLLMADQAFVVSFVVGEMRQSKVRKFLESRRAKGSVLVTDCYDTFKLLSENGTRRSLAQMVPTSLSGLAKPSETITSFVSYFSPPIKNQHKRLDCDKLWLYLNEYQFRFNRRSRSKDIFADMVGEFPYINDEIIKRLQDRNSGAKILRSMS